MNEDKKKQGSGFFAEDDPDMEKHREAGQQGGETVAEERGSEFYHEIGQKGGKSAQESGSAHELTEEERAQGGRQSHGGGRPSEDED